MRCDYCGWQNADGVQRCVKCNQLLPEHIDYPEVQEKVAASYKTVNPLNATVPLQGMNEEEMRDNNSESAENYCISCGYPIALNSKSCPVYGAEISVASEPKMAETQNRQSFKATVADVNAFMDGENGCPKAPYGGDGMRDIKEMAGSKKTVKDFRTEIVAVGRECKLVPMDNFDGLSGEVVLSDRSVVINRASIDPENLTVDENAHASFTCEDGEWFVNNLSKSRTTYVSTDRKVKLSKGDIIIIGNRRYIFQ